jgi:hypothetical protein
MRAVGLNPAALAFCRGKKAFDTNLPTIYTLSMSPKIQKHHQVGSIAFAHEQLILVVDGEKYQLPLSEISVRLVRATPQERETYRISPLGLGIHWPLIDEDLSIDGLIRMKHKREDCLHGKS